MNIVTNVYFIRHARSDFSAREDAFRPLSQEGLRDRACVAAFLRDKRIDAVLSSPYRRAVETVEAFAGEAGLPVVTVDDFRERCAGSVRETDFTGFARAQWADFTYKNPGGESLAEVQRRNMAALRSVLRKYGNRNVVIGTHGTALSTILHFYAPAYGYADFAAMAALMPWAVQMVFDGKARVETKTFDILAMHE